MSSSTNTLAGAMGDADAGMDKTTLLAEPEPSSPGPAVGGGSGTIDALCMACDDATCDFKPMVLQRCVAGAAQCTPRTTRVHCALHCTLTAHCVLHTAHRTPQTAHCALRSEQRCECAWW